jgi:hypothetical protein
MSYENLWRKIRALQGVEVDVTEAKDWWQWLQITAERGRRPARRRPLTTNVIGRSTFMADDDLTRLSDDEKAALVALLKRTMDADRYRFSPRVATLKGILAKLEPPKAGAGPSTAVAASRAATRQGGRGGRQGYSTRVLWRCLSAGDTR